jgi:hypothetical protein
MIRLVANGVPRDKSLRVQITLKTAAPRDGYNKSHSFQFEVDKWPDMEDIVAAIKEAVLGMQDGQR